MDSGLARQLIGLPVHIGRSDGRVHLATVKSLDASGTAVMVEWNEKKSCRGKEVELSELWSLNPELLEYIENAARKPADPPLPAAEKKYEGRLRSSRIPAPSPSSAPPVANAEESVAHRSQARQTNVYVAPSHVPVEPETVQCPVLPTSSVLSNSAVPNQQHKRNKVKKEAAHLPEAVKENDEPQKMPPPAASIKDRRKTVSAQDLNKGNKRLSCLPKQPDTLNKRGKFGEAYRPNQKFYDMISEFRETMEVTPMTTSDHIEARKICVCIRKRPLNKQELNKKEIDVISVPGKGSLIVHEPKQKVDLTKYLENHTFHYDYSFDETFTNELVYRFTAKPLVQSIFEGGMATCFAYGQTGSGKTHTMGGDFTGKQQNSAKGIYALAAQDVFKYLNHKFDYLDVSAYVSFFEIYNGKVYDLLNKKTMLRVLEDERQQVQVVGLEEVYVSAAEEVMKWIQMGSACRTSGQTFANANSSRSHAILQIVLRRNDRAKTLHGKFSLVDLAGNERGTDVTSNARSIVNESAEINRSLLALKECIRSLGRNSDHIPFRMSTLTKVLRDSFIGEKSKTCMIAMVSPGMGSCDYTMNTLRYAYRVKELNGNSSANSTKRAQGQVESSVEGSDSDLSVSEVDEMSSKVYDELQAFSDLVELVDNSTHDIKAKFPKLLESAQKITDALLTFQAVVEQENLEMKF